MPCSSSAPAGYSRRDGSFAPIKLLIGGLTLQLAVSVAAPILSGRLFHLFREDGLVENLSAFCFLMTVFVALGRFRQGAADRNLLGVCVALGIVGFLDELAFGSRLFSFAVPRFGDIAIDGVHDIVSVAAIALRDAGPVSRLLVLGAAGTLVALLGWKYRDRVLEVVATVPTSPPRAALVLCLGLLVLAAVFDNMGALGEVAAEIRRRLGRKGRMIEELLELNAALSLLLAAVLATASRRGSGPGRAGSN